MDFHKSRTLTWFSLTMVVVGALGAVLSVAWLADENQQQANLVLVISSVILLAGLLGLALTFAPLKLRIDENGVRIRNRRERVDLPDPVPWQVFDAVTIEPKPGERDKDPYLVVWPKGRVPGLPEERAIRRGDASGFPLVRVSELTEPADQLIGALRHYAGELFRETTEQRTNNA
ncbi:hypothetical protein [Saccharomonospora glauca]|uniref:Uncharacterized protein n=1 Tax=Saccharomonospora glauca K62 TaxID=928724 RepID=I1D4N4_9PSEU|nr:hypothetical protein [Saccharomonospora glauca]EIE99908.1 hypothetical protein SacglDRAFT_03042 [Saccharomonospora glauca K62]